MVFDSQSDKVIHILEVRASVQPWWPNKAIKLNLNFCVETLQYRSTPLKEQTHEKRIYVFLVMNKFTCDECGM